MSRVVLVRHALPVADPDVDSRAWVLAGGARDDCVRLADALGVRAPVVYASAETKAVDTAVAVAERLGAEVRTDERFGEVVRPWSDGDYRAIATRYLRDGNDGWEPRDAVVARFSAAIDAAGAGTHGTIVVNHGLAMSLYVASVADIDVVAFWTGLTFPDAWLIDSGAGSVRRLFDDGSRA